MYSKEQAAKIKQQFWTRFGQYMKPVPSSTGEAVNWINYKTGKKDIYFRTNADQQQAMVSIELKQADTAERLQCYQLFVSLKKWMESETGLTWDWEETVTPGNGQPISRISHTLQQVNIMNEQDWPAIISFLKAGILALDSFWEMAKDGFE